MSESFPIVKLAMVKVSQQVISSLRATDKLPRDKLIEKVLGDHRLEQCSPPGSPELEVFRKLPPSIQNKVAESVFRDEWYT